MHCVEHLAGRNCVHPQFNQIRTKFDEFVCNRAGRCTHSITLGSPTSFRTPASSNSNGMEKERGRGPGSRTSAPWSASGRDMASPWLPGTVPPLSPATARPSRHRPAPLGRGIWSPRTPPHSLPCVPGAAQATAARARSGPPRQARATPPHTSPAR